MLLKVRKTFGETMSPCPLRENAAVLNIDTDNFSQHESAWSLVISSVPSVLTSPGLKISFQISVSLKVFCVDLSYVKPLS